MADLLTVEALKQRTAYSKDIVYRRQLDLVREQVALQTQIASQTIAGSVFNEKKPSNLQKFSPPKTKVYFLKAQQQATNSSMLLKETLNQTLEHSRKDS